MRTIQAEMQIIRAELEINGFAYVSHSTSQSDLKNVQASLKPLRLNLSRDWSRLSIRSAEIDKRICLGENELYLTHLQGFDNDVLTLNIAIHHMQKKFFIKDDELTVSGNIDKELAISRKIFERISARSFCEIPESEIEFFAVYLKGKEIFQNHDIISAEMPDFINDAFAKIRQVYGVDFTNNISLGISIALHVIPLIVRIKHNMQIRSKSLANVKRTFPLGYEMIAAHFYGSLLELHQHKKRTRVLVLSEMKVSMTILLRSILMKWFIGEISVLDFLTTEKTNSTTMAWQCISRRFRPRTTAAISSCCLTALPTLKIFFTSSTEIYFS